MSLFATERVPQPVVVLGVVDRDLQQADTVGRPSALASGYERLNWRTAHQQLVQAEQTGWRTARPVWPSAPGAVQVASVVAGDYQSLLVHFPSGEQTFQNLIGKPGLVGWVSVDRSAGRFIGVKFTHRP